MIQHAPVLASIVLPLPPTLRVAHRIVHDDALAESQVPKAGQEAARLHAREPLDTLSCAGWHPLAHHAELLRSGYEHGVRPLSEVLYK